MSGLNSNDGNEGAKKRGDREQNFSSELFHFGFLLQWLNNFS